MVDGRISELEFVMQGEKKMQVRTIWKYVFSRKDIRESFFVPKGSRILSFGFQSEDLVMWALVDPEATKEERVFEVVGTGWIIDDYSESFEYIDTVQYGSLVWHIFERKC